MQTLELTGTPEYGEVEVEWPWSAPAGNSTSRVQRLIDKLDRVVDQLVLL
jgi:hypothetical protein